MAGRLRLKKHEERRLRAGHPWIFSNEVDVAVTPLAAFAPGDPVVVESAAGKPLGAAYVNPHSLICARLYSRDADAVLDASLLHHRFNIALGLRERLYAEPYYRLAFGEGDALPGLVVDRYGDVLVVQITTAGMERVKDAIVAALDKRLRPRAILLRNDVPARELEGLPRYVEAALGDAPEEVELVEQGVRFLVPLREGQKTGWYFDQRANRARMRAYVSGRRVLDVFSYLGGWGVQAACAGAAEVLCIDSSARAVGWARRNAALNGVEARVQIAEGDAFEALRRLRAEGRRFGAVVCDPPAFIKRRKDVKEGEQAYRRLNQAAMQLLERDGMLITSSCSYHLERATFQQLLAQAGAHLDRSLALIEQGQQAPDHPVHPAIPETAYLKTFFVRVLPRQ